MFIGVLRQACKNIPDEVMREQCARVAFGMLGIYSGQGVEESLSIEALASEDMNRMIDRLIDIRDGHTQPVQVGSVLQLVAGETSGVI